MSTMKVDVVQPVVGSISATISDFFNFEKGDIKINTGYSENRGYHILYIKQNDGEDEVAMVKQEVEHMIKVLQESLKVMTPAIKKENS